MAIIDSVKKRITRNSSSKKEESATSSKSKSDRKVNNEVSKKVKKGTRLKTKFYNIVKHPIVTEKSHEMSDDKKFISVFEVSNKANKSELKKLCEAYYETPVLSVKIINQRSKKRRRGNSVGVKSGYKKAIIRFAKKVES